MRRAVFLAVAAFATCGAQFQKRPTARATTDSSSDVDRAAGAAGAVEHDFVHVERAAVAMEHEFIPDDDGDEDRAAGAVEHDFVSDDGDDDGVSAAADAADIWHASPRQGVDLDRHRHGDVIHVNIHLAIFKSKKAGRPSKRRKQALRGRLAKNETKI